MRSVNFRCSIRIVWLVSSSPAARASLKFIVVLLAVVLPISIVLTQSGLHAGANTITVNSLADSATTSGNGFCDLREAIDNAQSNTDTTGGDCAVGMGNATIYFGVSGTITLVSDLPSIGSSHSDRRRRWAEHYDRRQQPLRMAEHHRPAHAE